MSKEYIEREDAIAEFMREFPDAHYPSWYAEKLKNIPTADVVEVVRCGECIHSKERNKIKDTVICTKYNAYKDINGFCESGEKKDE